MTNFQEQLVADFLEKYGDYRLSEKHGFIAHERSRTKTHVIVGYSYRYFGTAKTVISQFEIPVKEWDNPDLFVSMTKYVNSPYVPGKKYCLTGINYDMSIDAFFYEDIIDHLSTSKEREHRKKPPYVCCDLPVRTDFYD